MNYWIDNTRQFYPSAREPFPLIHMTQRWDTLVLILKEGFKPSYCKEHITDGKEKKEACFPMISLSNVSLDYAISYQSSYGTVGVALNKSWGERHDFNPVLYLERTSDLTENIISNFSIIAGPTRDNLRRMVIQPYDSLNERLTNQTIKIFAHSKNYDGQLIRNGKLEVANYPFGMEREWRKIVRDEKIAYFLAGDEIKKTNEFTEMLQDVRIDFLLTDINAIIVESEYEEKEVIKIIKEKYKLSEFPKNIEIRINPTRHVPDEG